MNNKYITAFAPASIGNVAVGFDMLGLAIKGAGDRVSVRKMSEDGLSIKEIYDQDGLPHKNLSKKSSENTASIAADALWQSKGGQGGIEMIIHKGIPLQSGMGSSAASAVAGAVAVNALLDNPLPVEELMTYALEGEKYASGGIHADNVAPSLIGGMVFCPPSFLPRTTSIEVPKGISSVLVHPDLIVNTAESRNELSDNYSMKQWLDQQGYLAGFLLGLQKIDLNLIKNSMQDVIIEPQRASSVECFNEIKEAIMNKGALGCSLSGSGPSIFALCEDHIATEIKLIMMKIFTSHNISSEGWISSLDASGAYVES
jgi:homoserine kinase